MENDVKQKSVEIFNKLFQTSIFDLNDLIVVQLSGISNRTFKCSLNISNPICLKKIQEAEIEINKHSKKSNNVDESQLHIDTPITTIIYKQFGKISIIVDRKLESMIIENLSLRNKGPKILDTDYEKYRVEEYITNTRNIKHSEVFNPEYLNQVVDIFHIYTSLTDYNKYLSYIKYTNNKELLLDQLLKENSSNLFTFSKKMLEIAYNSLSCFEKEFIKDKDYWDKEKSKYIESSIEKIKQKLDSSIKDMLCLVPETPILVLSHNDAHPGNILVNDKNKLFLIDHEYCLYNYLGFDQAHFILEHNFTLDFHEYPYYKQFSSNEVYHSEDYYNFFKRYVEEYFEINKNRLNNFNIKTEKDFNLKVDVNQLVKSYSSKENYYNMIGLTSIYWFIFAVIYVNYDEYKNKSNFNYLEYSLLRHSVYDYLCSKDVSINK